MQSHFLVDPQYFFTECRLNDDSFCGRIYVVDISIVIQMMPESGLTVTVSSFEDAKMSNIVSMSVDSGMICTLRCMDGY